jgi:8-hydroxy-5-deazaflavin:NADPH oxidoreductase
MKLVEEIGFEALYIGDITLSRLLEPFGMTWIHSAIKMGMGRDWAFHVVRR